MASIAFGPALSINDSRPLFFVPVLLSILAIDYRLSGGKQEAASIVAIILLLLSVGAASLLRAVGMQMGMRHQ